MLGARSKAIGLTLDRTGATVVRLRKKKFWEIDNVQTVPLPADCFEEDLIVRPDEIRDILASWVKRNKLQGAAVTLAFPSSQVIVRRMRIQTTNAKQLPGLIALEVETTLHLPFEDPVHDYVKLGEDAESTQVLVFAVSRQLIETYVRLLEEAGLHVGAIELAATALARAIRIAHGESFAETMLIHLDDRWLEIYMFHGGQPVFLKSIELLGHTDENGGKLTDGQLAEVTAEIARMLNFYQFSIHEGNSRITEALLTGSEEGRAQLLAELQQTQPEMSIRAISFEPYRQKPDDEPDKYRAEIGLALWRQDPKRINLLPRIDREARLYPVLLTSAAVVWLAAAVACGYLYFGYKSDQKDDASAIGRLHDQIALLEGELQLQNSEQSSQTNPLEIIEKVRGGRRDAIAVLDELRGKLPQDSFLQSISYSSSGQIGLTVRFADYAEAARYLFDLRQMSFASSAQLQSISRGSSVQSVAMETAVYSIQLKPPEGGDANGDAAGQSK